MVWGTVMSDRAWRAPEQDSEELFETVSQCLLSGMDRDALSGWGAVIYVMCVTPRS